MYDKLDALTTPGLLDPRYRQAVRRGIDPTKHHRQPLSRNQEEAVQAARLWPLSLSLSYTDEIACAADVRGAITVYFGGGR